MADAEAEVALAAIEDGDGVEGVQLYVCGQGHLCLCLLYTSPSPRDGLLSRMPSSA